ncbi:hypothetical protein HYALB_00013485 [Hymenoscyphus albidus]|uniref:Ubiquitin-like domain-containing protein n=1 Tax=Hymenoscyphus albidus TaxID=595503 RepID=A0A9N9PZ34_9HELO|nr:hypothetical protein HYALB_00013485 [Hymenoscyphus albidus]
MPLAENSHFHFICGMEELINQAFLHMEVIGPHVLEGHYDLIGPSGEIILPQVWERTVEPDLVITMRIWHNVIGESKDPEWASVLF